MHAEILKVVSSRVIGVRRADPYRFSIDDEAIAEFGPGLLQFLNLQDRQGRRIGEGIRPEWTIPVGAAGTAAYGVVEPAEGYQPNAWTGVTNVIEWVRPCREDEVLWAVARLDSLGRTSATIAYQVYSREGGDLLVRGQFVFVAADDQGPHAYIPNLFLPALKTSPHSEDLAACVSTQPLTNGHRKLRGAKIADKVLPDASARFLRTLYWNYRDWRRSPGSSPLALVRVLTETIKAPGEAGEGRKTWRGRLGDYLLPQTLTQSLRHRYWVYLDRKRRPQGARWTQVPGALAVNGTAPVEIEVLNPDPRPSDFEIVAELPYGFGLDFQWVSEPRFHLKPGEVRRVAGRVLALRPDEVNLGRPWGLTCFLMNEGREVARLTAEIAVPDPNPGEIFYVLTEDCETFDGGEKTGAYGELKVLGNHNNFMDPEDYRVQMIEKPKALNAIAEKHGACWTHFWTATQRFAAAWAAQHSPTGAWQQICEDLDESIRRGSRRHEYAPHIHFGFDPDSQLPPQPRLIYDPATDGFLPNEYYDPVLNPNHQYHGWDGSRKSISYVKREGTLEDLDSKVGSLRKSARHLAKLTFGGKASLTTRTGACDFGATAEDLEISARALFANGFLANADAGVYENWGGHPRGRQIYFCRRDDLEPEVDDLRDVSLVQLRAPEVMFDTHSLAELNAWVDRRLAASTGPGVRALIGLTHAMFVKGAPDPYRDLSGGDFDKIDRHLEYVRRSYPHVRFATASEVVLEFLDYYSPTLRAVVTTPRTQSLDGETLIYPVRLLGRGIPVSPSRPMPVTVQAPPYLDPEEVRSLTVLEDGRPIASAASRRDRLPQVEFLARGREGYELEIRTHHRRFQSLVGHPGLAASRDLWSSPSVTYEEPPEPEKAAVFKLAQPRILTKSLAEEGRLTEGDSWVWLFPADLFRLLINPMAGGTEPVGRRYHPYGRLAEGAALHSALAVCGERCRPLRCEVHWIKPVKGKSDFQLHCTLSQVAENSLRWESSFFEAEIQVSQMRVVLSR